MRSLSFPVAAEAVAFDAVCNFVATGFDAVVLTVVTVGAIVCTVTVVEVIIELELFVKLLATTIGVGAETFDACIIGFICVEPILMGAVVGTAAAADAAALAEAAAAAAAFAAAAFCCFIDAGVA